jgi:hypothetical protein
VQEYLADKTFSTSGGWGMTKRKDEGKQFELVRLSCRREKIETMCNEILGNYTKKEHQFMTVAFGTWEKRRLNQVMDAIGFEYPDYDKLDEEVRGVKKKRVVNILKRQAIRSIKKDRKKKLSKRLKVSEETEISKMTPKPLVPKKQKIVESNRDEEENSSPPKRSVETPSASSIGVTEILEVMTKPLPFAMLSPLGSELRSLL